MGNEPPPPPPSWFEGYVMAFYRQCALFFCELRDVRNCFHTEVDTELTPDRKRCRRCKRMGYSAAEPCLTCENHGCTPAGYSDRLKRREWAVYDRFVVEAAQWALDQKSADDKLAMKRQKQEEDKRLEREARRASALESMMPLCLRCAACFHLDFGILGQEPEQM